MNSLSSDTDNGAGVFDALLALFKHLRLLIVGPLVVAGAVVGALSALPPTFTSKALLMMPKETRLSGSGGSTSAITPLQVAAVMKSVVVLDQVLLALNPGSGSPDDKARDVLSTDIQATVGKDGMLRVEVTAGTALDAQKIANLLIDSWLRTTTPAPLHHAELEKRLVHARQTLLTTQAILASQKTALLSMAGLGELMDRYFEQTLEIERQMKGLTRDVIVQAPTLASRPKAQPYFVIFLQMVFGAELFFIMWVLGRHALEAAKVNSKAGHKLQELRDSLGNFREGDSNQEKSTRVDGT